MKLWSDLYDLIMPDLPGCPFAAVNNALRQSSIVFCAQSLAWKDEHPPVAVARRYRGIRLHPAGRRGGTCGNPCCVQR